MQCFKWGIKQYILVLLGVFYCPDPEKQLIQDTLFLFIKVLI